jgi:hypothetical protein
MRGRDIDEEIRKQATNCPRNFACFDGEPLCQVDHGTLFFVVPPAKIPYCPYIMAFGDGHVCHCPVRREIFRRHGQ